MEGDLYVRLAGAARIASTAFGSTAYSMAAGGPVLASGTPAFVCTPLAMHGGSAPPLVVPATAGVKIDVHPSFAGFEVQIDGHAYALEAVEYELSMHEDKVTLVSLDQLGLGVQGLRDRGLITDSPRVLARDARSRK